MSPSQKTLPDGSNQLTPTPLPVAFESASLSHAGTVRETNEDVCGVFDDLRLFVIADGMGGRASGEIAAQVAVNALETFFRDNLPTPKADWPFPNDPRFSVPVNLLRVGMKVANQSVRDEAKKDPAWHRMGATMSALTFDDEQLVAANVGDVRIYRHRNGHLSRLTRDHSLVEEMKAVRPDLSQAEIEAIAPRNVVTRALGTKPDVEATVLVNSFQADDTYLLCSDGLWGVVPEPNIASILDGKGDLGSLCYALVDAANQAGGPDNISVLLVRVRR